MLHAPPGGTALAYRHCAGAGPLIVFLPGYMSDMRGSKAQAVFSWAQAEGRSCLLLDYAGCGESAGEFAHGTLSRWRDDVLALIEHVGAERVVLVGSSMGGWLMLLVALRLGDRIAGLVGIAAAPDFTEWGYPPQLKAQLAAGEMVFEDNNYGPEPMPTHAAFWADGQANRLLDDEIAIDCPVRLIHGQNDTDVPWETALRLAAALRSPDVQVALVKDGDHRLSRPSDIALLLRTLDTLCAHIHDA